MRRGTTPTLTFILPFSTEGMDVLNIAFSQNNKIVFQKTLTELLGQRLNPVEMQS